MVIRPPASGRGGQVEALRIEAESLPKRVEIDAEVGGIVMVLAMLVARRAVAPGSHARARLIGQLFAQKGVEPLERREWVVLERREVHVEKKPFPACVAKRDHPLQPE